MSTVAFHELRITLPDDWEPAEEEGDGLLTVVRPDGVGALQMSTAVYRGGVVPHITVTQLRQMLEGFAASEELLDPMDEKEEVGPPIIVAASYHAGANFIRAWYVSDLVNTAFATYVSEWEDRDLEVADCEAIVRSIQFATV